MITKRTKKKKLKLRWDRIFALLLIISIIVNIILILLLCNISKKNIPIKSTVAANLLMEENNDAIIIDTSIDEITETKNEIKNDEIIIEENQEENKNNPDIKEYRLTSFWSGDGMDTGSCTGSGLCEKDFQINDKGWYTYNGYLVLAGATTYLQKKYGIDEGKDYYKYYDIVNLTIDGITYQGIILDTCGASYTVKYEQRLDLFVSNASSKIDRGYKGQNTIQVWREQ